MLKFIYNKRFTAIDNFLIKSINIIIKFYQVAM
jgi:hypothetical protein